MKKLMFVVLTLGAVLLSAAEFTVKPENAVIVVDLKGDAIPRLAAEELQYYVKMMTGKTMPVVDKAVPGKYAFIFKKPANVKLKPEEAVWEVTPKQTVLYGDSAPYGRKMNRHFIFRYIGRTGDLSATHLSEKYQRHGLPPEAYDIRPALCRALGCIRHRKRVCRGITRRCGRA